MSTDRTITIKDAPEPRGPYVHARRHGGLVYVTAQIGRDPKTGEFVKGGFEAEFNQAIDNLEAILKDSGSSLDHVVKAQIEFVDEGDVDSLDRVVRTQIMYTDQADEDVIDAVFATRFPPPRPARTTWGVRFLAAEPGTELVRVQIDCLAETA